MKKGMVYAAAALAVAGAVVVGGRYVLANRPLTVSLAAVERNVPVDVFGLGTVEAQILSSIGFEVGAALVELGADHGDAVKRGAILARLHSAEQESRLARVAAGVASAEAIVARAETMVGRQAAILEQMQETNRRQQELAAKNVISIDKAEESAKELKVAEADHALANADVQVARAALMTARADLAHETTLLEHHTLRAPFDGVVVERQGALGAVVKPGDAVFTIADPASIWILAHIEESRAGVIALNQEAAVRLRALPAASFKGRVARIGIESDRVTEERRVWVKCEDCPKDFHLGEQAEVIITAAILDSALMVPEAAVLGFDGHGGKVWTLDNGAARQIAVSFGLRTLDGRVQVTGGLPEGARIVVDPPDGIRDGRALTAAGVAGQ